MINSSIPAPVRTETASLFPVRSPFVNTKILSPISSTPSGKPPSSVRIRARSAFTPRSKARSIPRPSITSFVARIPAVSNKVTGNPLRSIRTSTTSRVVPSISEVIAASLPASLFKRLDFPTLGLPRMTTSNPERSLSAKTAPSASACKTLQVSDNNSLTSG